MSTNFIDEYLVRLGASVDASGMQRFNQALREATAVSTSSATSIAGAFFKTQVELTAGFAAIGGAVIGLVDKVAMADQSYRLFAMHMYMTKDAARGLKIAMDALDQPLENLTWDRELRGRTTQLLADQRAMAPTGDFNAQMRKVRDIRFEFTRMEVEGQYLAMHIVQDFMAALGVGPDMLLLKLKKFNNWIITNIPYIAEVLTNDFMPIWRDIEDMAKQVGVAVHEALQTFELFVGFMSDDASLEDGTVSFEKLAKALEHVAHFMALVLEGMIGIEGHTIGSAHAALLAMRGATDYVLGDKKDAKVWLGKADKEDLLNTPTAPGFKAWAMAGVWNRATDVHTLIDKYAAEQGVDPALAHAIAMHESGERQFGTDGQPLRNPGSTATGVFQLLNGTAQTLGVDSSDTKGNIHGGVLLLAQMLKKYNGNLPEAIGGYQVGGGMMDKVLAGKATLSDTDKSNIGNILQRMGQHGDVHVGSIVIHIDKPGATNDDVGKVVADRIRGLQDKKVQRNLSELGDAGWSY